MTQLFHGSRCCMTIAWQPLGICTCLPSQNIQTGVQLLEALALGKNAGLSMAPWTKHKSAEGGSVKATTR